jgi:hypothetical protein
MTEGFASIITLLENRKSAIDRALVALRDVDGMAAPATTSAVEPATPEAPTQKRKRRSAAVRRRMQEAQRLRWARIRGESEPAPPATPEAPKAKRKISAAGMKRIIAATKRRWALKRAEAKAAVR